MTQSNIKTFQPSPKLVRLYELTVVATHEVERVRGLVLEYQSRILRENRWTNSLELKHMRDRNIPCESYVILDPEMSYLMSYEDNEQYQKLCYEAAVGLGFELPNPCHCPLLIAEDEQGQAIRNLLSAFHTETYEFLKISFGHFWALYKDIYPLGTKELFVKMIGDCISKRNLEPFVKLAEEIISDNNK